MNSSPDPYDAPPPKLMSGPFWIMMAFAAVCMMAAMVVAVDGPRLFGPPPAKAARANHGPVTKSPAPPTLGAKGKGG